MKATAKDLRFHSRELLDTVNRGEKVVITYRSKPCAKLVPYEEENKILFCAKRLHVAQYAA
jgi:prevent-host-death family protein